MGLCSYLHIVSIPLSLRSDITQILKYDHPQPGNYVSHFLICYESRGLSFTSSPSLGVEDSDSEAIIHCWKSRGKYPYQSGTFCQRLWESKDFEKERRLVQVKWQRDNSLVLYTNQRIYSFRRIKYRRPLLLNNKPFQH